MRVVPAAGDVILHEEAGEAFLLHLPTGRYYGLNRTGLVIWQALVAGSDPVEALASHWPTVPLASRRADTEALIASLVAAGLAQTEDGQPEDEPPEDAPPQHEPPQHEPPQHEPPEPDRR